jgi:nucleoid DNA-binding protein
MLSKQKAKFFNDLALEMGLLNDADARKYYYDIVRYVVRTANTKDVVELPDLGTFQVIVHKGRRSCVNGLKWQEDKEITYIPPKRTLKFYPDRKVKEHLDKYLEKKLSGVV